MLVNRPSKVICKVGNYDIIVRSENQLEDSNKFDNFCQEFKMVLLAMTKAASNEKAQPAIAHEELS